MTGGCDKHTGLCIWLWAQSRQPYGFCGQRLEQVGRWVSSWFSSPLIPVNIEVNHAESQRSMATDSHSSRSCQVPALCVFDLHLGIRLPSSSDDPGRHARLQVHRLLGTWAKMHALYFTCQLVRQRASFQAAVGKVASLGQAG